MHTSSHRENVIQPSGRIIIEQFVERNERVSVGAERSGILKIESAKLQFGLFPFAIVPLLAGNLTGAAANALGSIDQRCLYEGRAR
jgi:hypothetical protein